MIAEVAIVMVGLVACTAIWTRHGETVRHYGQVAQAASKAAEECLLSARQVQADTRAELDASEAQRRELSKRVDQLADRVTGLQLRR